MKSGKNTSSGRRAKSGVTMDEIAAAAGVSKSTVSRALAGSPRISVETRLRIAEIAGDRGYRVNRAARALRSAVSGLVGFVIPNIRNPFYSEIAFQLERNLSVTDQALIVVNTSTSVDAELSKVRRLISHGVDGVIIAPVSDGSRAIHLLREHGIPVVQIDRTATDDADVSSVLLDNVLAGQIAVEYAAGLGIRRLGIITGHPQVTTGRERLQGALEAARRLGVRLDSQFVKSGEYTEEAGYWLTRQLLETGEPDVIVAMTNLLSLGAFRAIRESRKAVRLLAFDESDWYRLVDPPVPYVAQPLDEIARLAAKVLFEEQIQHYRVLPRVVT